MLSVPRAATARPRHRALFALLAVLSLLVLPPLASAQEGSADLQIRKDGPSVAAPGEVFDFNLFAVNSELDGPAATGVVVTDTLPSNLEFVSAEGAPCTAGGPDLRVVTCDIGEMPARAGVGFDVTVRAVAEGAAENVATIRGDQPDPEQSRNTARWTTVITSSSTTPEADVGIVKSGPETATVGRRFRYVVDITNDGPDAATNVSFTDFLPRNLEFVSATGAVCTMPNGRNNFSCYVGTVLPGATARVTLVVRAVDVSDPDASRPANCVVLSVPFDLSPDNDEACAEPTDVTEGGAPPDVSIDKQAPATARPGDTFDYTLSVTNNGPGPATEVTVTDQLPAGVSYESSSGADCTQAAGTVTCTIAEIAEGESAAITITVRADTPGTQTNTAEVASDGDPDASNNTDSASTEVGSGAPATITLTPASAVNPVGTQHCVTATVTDASGARLPGETVRFSVVGVSTAFGAGTSGSSTTGAEGQTTFCYQGSTLPGSDTINAYADTNANGSPDAGEPAATASKTWRAGTTSSGCDVDGRGTLTGRFGTLFNVDVSGGSARTGPSGSVSYVDLLGRVWFQSARITAVVVSGGSASIFGDGRDGRTPVTFRVDVVDGGRRGIDRFRITLSNGYTAEGAVRLGGVEIDCDGASPGHGGGDDDDSDSDD